MLAPGLCALTESSHDAGVWGPPCLVGTDAVPHTGSPCKGPSRTGMQKAAALRSCLTLPRLGGSEKKPLESGS